MIKNLVIVESPAKAKTIEKYLGKDYKVTSSMGHIRDLAKGDDAIDIAKGFEPKYEISPDKKELVKTLKKLVSESEMIWLATDEDREGEAISWHLYEVLGLTDANTKRIVFHEITKPAILKAIENPRKIDNFLVDAQQARRLLDRLVGYELSPVLWKKVKSQLSAGRVQSVAVRLVVEREREINDFHSKSEFRVTALFETTDKKHVKALCPTRFKEEDEARAMLQGLINASYTVLKTEIKPTYRNPAPPFTTSTLQQEASRKLGLPVARTMQLAQRLYESGHITYMRTDSVNLSQTAIGAAIKQVTNMFGAEYSNPRNYTTKNDSAQEAHEAIRPTYFENIEAGEDNQQMKLYELIWKRALASQMARAELEKTTVNIGNSGNKELFVAEGEVIKFDGFLKVYLESTDDEDEEDGEGMLPKMNEGENLNALQITATEKYSKPAARYTEASLVKKLEELGIGRPSTYAPTISTVQKRGYVVGESRDGKTRDIHMLTLQNGQIKAELKQENYGYEKNKLFPTDIGILVTDFLQDNFKQIMDYGFTASVEKEFDEIAEGMKSWQKMLDGFYKPFHDLVTKTTETAERVTGERILGKDPKSGKTVLVRIGRYGPLVQLGHKDDGDEPLFASLNPGQSIETISLEDGLKLFSLPREVLQYEGKPLVLGIGRYGPYMKYGEKFYPVQKGTDLISMSAEVAEELLKIALAQPQYPLELGEYEGETLTVNKGRFGPYIKFGSAFVSIPRGEDPTQVTLKQAIELIQAKAQADKDKILKTFEEDKDLQIVKGRYGPFLQYAGKNVALPKGVNYEDMSFTDLQKMGKAAPAAAKSGARGSTKKPTAAAKKPAAKKPAAKKKPSPRKKK